MDQFARRDDLECVTVTGALIGAYLAGVVPQEVLEFLFALMMLQSVYFSLSKQRDDLVPTATAGAHGAVTPTSKEDKVLREWTRSSCVRYC